MGMEIRNARVICDKFKPLVFLSKPSGIRSHPNRHNHIDTNALFKLKYDFDSEAYVDYQPDASCEKSKVYLVHRLDAATTGIMAVSMNDKDVALKLKDLLREHLIRKTYYAICISEDLHDKGALLEFRSRVDGKEAFTRAQIQKSFSSPSEKYYLNFVKMRPETGRKHQLRIHCAGNNLPILGDSVHGNFKANRELFKSMQLNKGLMFLHAHSLEIRSKHLADILQFHMDRRSITSLGPTVKFTDDLPEHFTKILSNSAR